MIGFLPTPYPDEILYSVLSRYHIRSGSLSHERTRMKLYGSTSTTNSIEFPCRLRNLVERLPEGSTYTVEDFIENNSLFPLYRPFLPDERAEAATQLMMGEDARALYSILGFTGSSLKAKHHLSFCPQCLIDDYKRYGEVYWHRIHQIPGIIICPDHSIFLVSSSVILRGLRRTEFVSASKEVCVVQTPGNIVTETMDQHFQLAQDAKYLLSQHFPAHNSQGWFQRRIVVSLQSRGYLTINGSLRTDRFIHDFSEFYGDIFLNELSSTVSLSKSNWLTSLARKEGYTSSPVRYLLLAHFLGHHVSELFTETEHVLKPFGNGPWTCYNGASDHYGQRTIKNVELVRSDRTKEITGRFKCDCGYVYTQSSTSGRRFVRECGPIWEQVFIHLVDDGIAPKEIATRLRVCPATVRHKLRRINTKLSPPKTDVEQLKKKYRSKWLELQRRFPRATKSKLSKIDSGTRAWLYRNDRTWYGVHSPSHKVGQKRNSYLIDWRQRDIEIMQRVRSIVSDELHGSDRPRRITKNFIGRKLGNESILRQSLGLMPKTCELIMSVVESTEVFESRKVRWYAEELKRKGLNVTRSKLRWDLGLTMVNSPIVFEAINKMVGDSV